MQPGLFCKSLCHYLKLINQIIIFFLISIASLLLNHLTKGPEILRQWSPTTICYMSHVMLYICHMSSVSCQVSDFFSKHRPSGPMLSISRNVRLSFCGSVGLFTFEVPFNGIFARLPEAGCQIFLEIRDPWGKVMERSSLTFEHFCLEAV